MEKEERLLTSVQIGKMAELTYSHTVQLLKAEHEEAVINLKNEFRDGMKDNQKIVMELARLVVVDNLEAKLKSQISASHKARKELENDYG